MGNLAARNFRHVIPLCADGRDVTLIVPSVHYILIRMQTTSKFIKCRYRAVLYTPIKLDRGLERHCHVQVFSGKLFHSQVFLVHKN